MNQKGISSIVIILIALGVLVLAGGTYLYQKIQNIIPKTTPSVVELQQDKNGNFVLYVSNQSFAINPVDIKIYIDGKIAVNQNFDVKGNRIPQHNWLKFQFALSKGAHKIQVGSAKGEAELEKEFEIKDKHWAVVDYWYYPEVTGGAGPTSKHFSFDIQDSPLLFE